MSYGSDHDLDDFMAEGAITQGDEGDIEAISTPFEGFTYTIKSKYKELHGAILALSSISWRALYIQPTGKGLTFLCRNEGRSAFGKIEFEEGYFSSIYEGKAPDMSTKRPPIVKISMKNALKAFKTSIGETRNLNYMKILIDPKSDVLTLKYHSLSECVTTKTINVMGPSKAGFRSKCDEQLLTSHLSISPSTLIKCIAHIKNNEEEIIFMIEPDSFSIKRGICGMNGEDEDVICGSKSSLDLKMFAKFNVAEKSLFYVDSHELQAFLKLANGYNSLLELKFLDVGCPFILRTTNHNVIKAEFLLSTDQPRCDDDDIGDFVNSFASSNLFQSVGVGEQGKTHAPQVSNIPIHNYIQTHLVTKADVTNDLVRVKLSISHSTEKMGKKNDPDRMKERLIVEKPNANEQSFILLESNQNQVTKFEKKEAMPSSDEDPDIMNVLQNSYNSSPYELSSTGFIGRSLPSVGSQKDNGTIVTNNSRKRESVESDDNGPVNKRRSQVIDAVDSQPSPSRTPRQIQTFQSFETDTRVSNMEAFAINELTQMTPKIGFNFVDDINDIVSETQFLNSSDIQAMYVPGVGENLNSQRSRPTVNTTQHASTFTMTQSRPPVKLPPLFGNLQRKRPSHLETTPSSEVHINTKTSWKTPTKMMTLPVNAITIPIQTSHSFESQDTSWGFFK